MPVKLGLGKHGIHLFDLFLKVPVLNRKTGTFGMQNRLF